MGILSPRQLQVLQTIRSPRVTAGRVRVPGTFRETRVSMVTIKIRQAAPPTAQPIEQLAESQAGS
jgi:hypothetical protein